jgi:F0F1-type ATP synthase assembly protein I
MGEPQMSEPPPNRAEQQVAEIPQKPAEQSYTERIKSYAQATAVTLGATALIGAGIDSATDVLPYADPQQWIVAGLVLIGIGAGQRIPSLIGGK